jgi:hypothetical protein
MIFSLFGKKTIGIQFLGGFPYFRATLSYDIFCLDSGYSSSNQFII